MKWRQLTNDVAVMSFPWRAFGIDFQRNVSLLRLRDGRVVIHSSAPFTAEDVAAIRRFGEPAWLVDATLMHDTFAKDGRGWERFFVRHVMRLPRLFGISVLFRMTISDRQAFARSMKALLQWNFERVVVAHREPVEKEAKAAVERALGDSGFLSHA